MSLIQEALKRQQQESEGEAPPAPRPEPPVSPAVPEYVPPPPAEPEPLPPAPAAAPLNPSIPILATPAAARDRRWPALLAVALVLLLLAAGGVWMLSFAVRKWPGPASREPAQVASQPPADPAAAPEPVAPLPSEAAPAAPAESMPPSPADPQPPARVPVVAAVEPEPDPVPAAVTSPPALSPAASPEVPQESESAAPPEKAVNWPYLQLQGFISGKEGSAILNGQVVNTGQSIQGVKVLSITPEGVRLEYQGQQQLIRQGRSTH